MAHATGNIPLQLHDWNVDFAVFCSYKYLNSGAGCVGGIFVHSRNFDKQYPQLDGWWGNQDKTRFQMKSRKNDFCLLTMINERIFFKEIERGIGANGYRVSNPSIYQCAALAASLEVNRLSARALYLVCQNLLATETIIESSVCDIYIFLIC